MADIMRMSKLLMLITSVLKCGNYPDKWKRANVVPVHKKEVKIFLRIIDQYILLSAENVLKSVFIIEFIYVL